jgi:hypothetical protein
MIKRITPPSRLNAAPFMAEDKGLAINATSEATSAVDPKRLSNELGRMVAKSFLWIRVANRNELKNQTSNEAS